nr:uncharacterized protein LOC128699955 [Cherax quadricarinatus]
MLAPAPGNSAVCWGKHNTGSVLLVTRGLECGPVLRVLAVSRPSLHPTNRRLAAREATVEYSRATEDKSSLRFLDTCTIEQKPHKGQDNLGESSGNLAKDKLNTIIHFSFCMGRLDTVGSSFHEQ